MASPFFSRGAPCLGRSVKNVKFYFHFKLFLRLFLRSEACILCILCTSQGILLLFDSPSRITKTRRMALRTRLFCCTSQKKHQLTFNFHPRAIFFVVMRQRNTIHFKGRIVAGRKCRKSCEYIFFLRLLNKKLRELEMMKTRKS